MMLVYVAYLYFSGIIGYASDLYTLVTDHEIADSDDDQLYYTELFLNPTTRVCCCVVGAKFMGRHACLRFHHVYLALKKLLV